MSVYYPSFNYLGINSRDRNLVVSHFDADNGESDTFLGMEPIYTEIGDNSRRLDYGAKYNSVATFRVTLIKPDESDLSVVEVREHLKWLTGSKKNSPLELIEHFTEDFIGDGSTANFELVNRCDKMFNVYINNTVSNAWTFTDNIITLTEVPAAGAKIKIAYGRIKYSFICRVTNAWQHKMDARTIGLILEFTSTSPFAFSAKQIVTKAINGATAITIDNDTDDLYGYTPVNIIFENSTGDSLIMTHESTGIKTEIVGLEQNEIITMSDNMMITSDNETKIFGNTFNFMFQRLIAGENNLVVNGIGNITFEYVSAYKIGDCAMDISVISDPIYADDGTIQLDMLPFSRISDLPNSFQAYNIQNVYSKVEVDALVAGIEIDEKELNAMLVEELN